MRLSCCCVKEDGDIPVDSLTHLSFSLNDIIMPVSEMEVEAGAEGATLGQAAEEVQRFRLDKPVSKRVHVCACLF